MTTSPDPVKHASRPTWPWLTVALLFLGIAITDPVLRLKPPTFRYLFAIDITQSMNVSDMHLAGIEVSRLEYAKSMVETATRSLPCGSEAGLAIFAAHRTLVLFSPVEVCANFQALSEMLKKINWRMAWTARSEVSKGLYSAIEAAGQIMNDTRLVFLTDGHEAPPLNRDILPPFSTGADIAGFIVGVGGTTPSRIPHLDEQGNVVGYWSHSEVLQVDVHSLGRPTSGNGEAMVGVNMADVARRIMLGQEHLSSLREPHLRELAARTGLDYVRLDSASTFVEKLHKETYARRIPVETATGWLPASLAFACLVHCLIAIPWFHRIRRNRHSLRSPEPI